MPETLPTSAKVVPEGMQRIFFTKNQRLVRTGVVFTPFVIAAVFYATFTLGEPFGWAFPLITLGCGLACGYVAWLIKTTVRQVPHTDETSVSSVAASGEQVDEFPWYLRYPAAAGLISFAVYLLNYDTNAQRWWVPFGLGALALLFMFEILFIAIFAAIFGGLVWMAFGAIAGIPTSVAIIIGALIIANGKK